MASLAAGYCVIMIFTSLSNPLHIDSVRVPSRGGAIGMTSCPGKKCPGAGGYHDRDLSMDLRAIRDWGAEILVSLIEEHEYHQVGIADFEQHLPEGMLHLKLPIEDASVPGPAWEQQWNLEGRLVRSVLRRGGRVCLHCMGGLGRTGMIAARLLVESGVHPEDAIRMVRAARPGTIETPEQEAYVRSFEGLWRMRDRFRGCLLAGACGDALGAPVAFDSHAAIGARFGAEGIRNFAPYRNGKAGLITDDTQMTLSLAEGLLRAAQAALYTCATEPEYDCACARAFSLGAGEQRHGHPTGYLASGTFARILCELAWNVPLAEAVQHTIEWLRQETGSEETIQKLQEALQRAESPDEASSCIARLGEGWVAEEALAIAVFCAVRAPSLEEGIVMAVNI
ncbi:MAG: ADP-ribosylglycohydrolase family protein, partial [Rectinemataceae bacterium]